MIGYNILHKYILNTSANSLYMNFNVNTIVNNVGSHSVRTLWMYQHYVFIFGLMMVQWTETCLWIFNTDRCIYCCVIDWNKLL